FPGGFPDGVAVVSWLISILLDIECQKNLQTLVPGHFCNAPRGQPCPRPLHVSIFTAGRWRSFYFAAPMFLPEFQ
ncbi:MAG: hypothetical protein ABSE16_10650, partial [Verrucomicrobiota bacterium]